MAILGYLWRIVRLSFRGTFRALEIGEAVTALIVHVLGWFVHAWKEPLEILFVVLACLLVLTFFAGLFVAAYASQKEADEKVEKLRNENRSKQNIQALRQRINDFISQATELQNKVSKVSDHPHYESNSLREIELINAEAWEWDARVLAFVKEDAPEFTAMYKSNAGLQPSPLAAMNATSLAKLQLITELTNRILRLNELQKTLSNK
jgi:hypothetical protein